MSEGKQALKRGNIKTKYNNKQTDRQKRIKKERKKTFFFREMLFRGNKYTKIAIQCLNRSYLYKGGNNKRICFVSDIY